eukprot:3350303-Pyramimonas_sp.AAC.1
MAAAGLIGASRSKKGSCRPFFVKKKKNQQRLVLDCRQTNLNFRRCPEMEIGAAENLAQLEVPEGETLYTAQAD